MKLPSFLFAILLPAMGALTSFAQSSEDLLTTITKMDAAVFAAFNAHDPSRLMSFFTKDVEFYHDKDGLSNYQQTAEGFDRLFRSAPDIRRELVAGTVEVYPLKDDGAIEIGQHRFTHTENGKEETGTFKFLMIWRKANDSWKLSRVVSYGH